MRSRHGRGGAPPRSLFDALLADSDDMTRRYEIVWDSLDEADSLESA
ncbi:hypothetical protein [Rhodococcus opacus]|nr:hypothetical protein [Rhodococcus opacus]MBV6760628.1 hypothetical protein [Rhodococcus opacus]